MKPWYKLSEESIWNGYRKLTKKVFTLPSGQAFDFEILNEGKVVCVLALTPENNIVLAKQFRPGPEKILLELPGGGVEKDEDPLAAAKRELLEETGFSGDFQLVSKSLSHAYSDLIRYNFVATNCVRTQEPQNDEREPIEVVELNLVDFRHHLKSEQLTDVATGYLGLDYLGLLS